MLVIEVTNLELKSFEFGTPLRHALFDGEHEIFELLISFGANVNSLTLDRDSLLHCCVKHDEYLDFAKILIQNGAMLTIKNQQRKTPFEVALSNKKLSSMKLIRHQIKKHHFMVSRQEKRYRNGKILD